MHRGPRSIPLCIQHHIPHPFHSKWFDPPIPKSQQFQYLILKIQGQGHSWKRWTLKVTTWVQHSVYSNPFRSMSICPPIPEIQHFQNLTLKIQGQGHGWSGHWKSPSGCNILSTHIPFVPCQSAIPFLRYNFFKIWPRKSKVKVMGEGNVESHKVGVTSYRFTSLLFHVNRPFHSRDTASSKFDLENPRSRSRVRWTMKVTKWM